MRNRVVHGEAEAGPGGSRVAVREVGAMGHDALTLATELLQRARRADPHAGIREAADAQWGAQHEGRAQHHA